MDRDERRHIAVLKSMKDRTPVYTGDGPKPQHYQACHAAFDAAIAALESRPAPTEERESVRSMDESGSPESVGCIAQAWIDERAQEVSRLFGPARCEITLEPAKALILSVDCKPWYVATTWRDAMNFAQLVRWSATGGNPAVTALATDTTPSRDEIEALKDPNVVHVNMLRGGIAKPSHAQIWHIYGAALAQDMPDDVRSTFAPSRDEEGSVDREAIQIIRGSANSHCFDDQILVGDECIAFASEPWTSRIAAVLKTSTPETQTVEGGEQ